MIGILISAWLDVRSKPLRTFAAIAGMIAAVLAVVLVDAAAVLSRDANSEYLARTFGRTATLGITQEYSVRTTDNVPTSPADIPPPPTSSLAQGDQVVRLLRENGVRRITTDISVAVVLTHGEKTTQIGGKWVTSAYRLVTIVDLSAGQFPQRTAVSRVPHAVISQNIAHQLGFSGPDAVGQTIWYADRRNQDPKSAPMHPVVIDAVASSLGPAADTSGILFVSDIDRPDVPGYARRSWLIHVNPADVPLVMGLVANDGPKTPDGQPVFTARRVDPGNQLGPVLEQQKVTARAVTWVALTIGGLGILGVGLASVGERAREFGLRRALGASTGRVFAGVIVQSLLEVLLAAAIAIPLAAVAVELFARQLVLSTLPLPASTALPVSSAVRGLLAALAVGLLAGLLPAIRAARASVVQALRA